HIAQPSKAAILAALGVDANDDAAVDAAIAQRETVHWMRMLPPTVVATVGAQVAVPVSIPLALGAKRASRTIALEYGACRSGSVDIDTLAIQERSALDQREFARVQLELPADLPLGYHALEVTLDTGLAGEARLIVAPERAFEPEAIQRGERV